MKSIYIYKRVRILFYFGYLLEMIIEIWQLIIIISWKLEYSRQFFTKQSSISVKNHVFQFKKNAQIWWDFSKMIEGQNFLFGCMHDYYYYYYGSSHHVNPISMRRRIKVPCILKREGFLNFLGEPCSLISIIIHKQYLRYSWATENDLQSHANKTKQNKIPSNLWVKFMGDWEMICISWRRDVSPNFWHSQKRLKVFNLSIFSKFWITK